MMGKGKNVESKERQKENGKRGGKPESERKRKRTGRRKKTEVKGKREEKRTKERKIYSVIYLMSWNFRRRKTIAQRFCLFFLNAKEILVATSAAGYTPW
jgi:hypothetical protein